MPVTLPVVGAYVDDSVLGATPEVLGSSLPAITEHLAQGGLQIQPSKSKLWMPIGATCEAPLSDIQQVDGFLLCGQALGGAIEDDLVVGAEGYVTRTVALQADRLAQHFCKVGDLPTAVQIALTMLRYHWPGKFTHLLRGMPVDATRLLVGRLQYALWDALTMVMWVPHLTTYERKICTLPVSQGGMGVVDLPLHATVCRAACLATMPFTSRTAPQLRHYVGREHAVLMSSLAPHMSRHPTDMLGTVSRAMC
eukprot:6456756-Amphidinium_carterae.2